jgi:hypothetical protein
LGFEKLEDIMYNVFNGEYPFDIHIATVEAEDEIAALKKALQLFSKEYPHCVVDRVPLMGINYAS